MSGLSETLSPFCVKVVEVAGKKILAVVTEAGGKEWMPPFYTDCERLAYGLANFYNDAFRSTKPITIQPGPIFWEVFRGAMTSHGIGVTKWGEERGFAVASLKPMATGATNGEKSKKVRKMMIDAVGRDTFHDLYVKHLKHEGLLPS